MKHFKELEEKNASLMQENKILQKALKLACKQLILVYDDEGCTYGDDCMLPRIFEDDVENLAVNYFGKAHRELYGFVYYKRGE